jgi:heavy metal efflux system protein
VLKPYNTWPNGESKEDLVRRMGTRLAQLPGYEIAFSQPIIDGVQDYVFEPHSDLSVRIYGDDFAELRRIGHDIATALEGVAGTTDVIVDEAPSLAQIAIKIDRQATARYGINVSDVTDLIQNGIGGGAVTQVFIGDRTYDVSVRFPEETRSSPQAIGNLVLPSSSGALVPLSQLAQIKLQSGESTINRDKNSRYLGVKFNFENRSLPALLADAKQAIAGKVKFDPTHYRLEWGGAFESEQRAEARLGFILGMILSIMIVLLYAQFGLLRQVALILGVVPLATLGGLVALHLTGVTLNVASAIGFVALFGVAVLNGVIMVANLNRVRELGLPLAEAVLTGAGERLRPVLMTATVATVGMLPAAMATGVGSDVQRSLATVVAGGLLPATLLTLFLIPTFYFVIETLAARRARSAPAEETSSA